jgi:hypothetical protein
MRQMLSLVGTLLPVVLSGCGGSKPAVGTAAAPTQIGPSQTSLSGMAGGTVLGQTSGRFTVSPYLLTPRAGHTTTLLPDGSLLVTGGGILNTEDVLEPSIRSETLNSSGAATPTGFLNFARQFHTATLLRNGRVVIAGGNPGSNVFPDATATAELYDPSTRQYTVIGSMTAARVGHTASLLPDGRVLIFGGAASGIPSAEIYDPANGTFTSLPSPSSLRSGHTATVLASGQVLFTGGRDSTGATLATAEMYDPLTNSFATVGSMGERRAQHTATLLPNGKVLVAGGGVVSIPGAGYTNIIAFPQEVPGVVSQTAELFDPRTAVFTSIGTMNSARSSHTATLLQDGTVLLCGGLKGWSNGYFSDNTAEIYDPATGSFKSAGTMNTGKFWHTATLLPNGTVALVGGVSQDYTLLVVESFK